jgi:nucleobase:cation symporter-1, NCS1 family
VLDQAGFHTPLWMLLPFLVIMAVFTFAIPLLGHATLIVAQKWLSYLLTALTLVMAFLTLPQVHWDYVPTAKLAAETPVATWFLGLATVLGAGAMSWVNYASDYSRYLPRNSSPNAIVGWVTFATFVPGVLYGGLGVIIGTLVDTSDPIANLPKILPSWFLLPFLVVIVAGVVANNVMNSYSSGLNLLALGVNIPRYLGVCVDGVITITAASVALFVYDFSTVFTEFLSFLIVVMTPWAGVFLVDFWKRSGHYKSEDLLLEHGGVYWYSNGFNWPGIIAMVLGIVAAALCANTPAMQGYVSLHYLGGADISPIVGLIVGAIIYAMAAPSSLTSTPHEYNYSREIN